MKVYQTFPTESPSQTQQIRGSLQSLNVDSILRQSFVPDFSVKAITEVIYVAVKRSLYLAAKRATLLEQSRRLGSSEHTEIDDEVEKVCCLFGVYFFV